GRREEEKGGKKDYKSVALPTELSRPREQVRRIIGIFLYLTSLFFYKSFFFNYSFNYQTKENTDLLNL
ncbi:hypothetical protein, partial [Aggregatibacter sp.]